MDMSMNRPVWKKRFISRWCVLGIPFLLMGAIALFIVVTRHSTNGVIPDDSDPIGFSVVPWVLFVLGAVFITVFRRVVIDKQANTIALQWGIIIPLKSTHYSLKDIQGVKLSRESRSTGRVGSASSSSITVYPVRLMVKENNLLINEPRNIIKARSLAEEIAKFIAAPLHDKSHDNLVIRQASELDQSAVRRENLNCAPKIPKSMTQYISVSNRVNGIPVCDIKLPAVGRRYSWINPVAGAVLVASIAVIASQCIGVNFDNLAFDLSAIIFNPLTIVPLFFAVAAYKVLKVTLPELNIIADKQWVVITKNVCGLKFHKRINSADIEELIFCDHDNQWGTGSLLFITDKKQISVWLCQLAEELDVCRGMMLFVMK